MLMDEKTQYCQDVRLLNAYDFNLQPFKKCQILETVK